MPTRAPGQPGDCAGRTTFSLMATYVEILRAIHECGADTVWIGMAATAVHGSNLISNDFDFFVRPDPSHLDRARDAMRQLGMFDSHESLTSLTVIQSGVTVTFTDSQIGPPVDLLTEIDGPTFDEVWTGSLLREVSGIPVRVADLRHIVASKRAANREKDRIALKRLEKDLGRELKESSAKYRVRRRRNR